MWKHPELPKFWHCTLRCTQCIHNVVHDEVRSTSHNNRENISISSCWCHPSFLKLFMFHSRHSELFCYINTVSWIMIIHMRILVDLHTQSLHWFWWSQILGCWTSTAEQWMIFASQRPTLWTPGNWKYILALNLCQLQFKSSFGTKCSIWAFSIHTYVDFFFFFFFALKLRWNFVEVMMLFSCLLPLIWRV